MIIGGCSLVGDVVTGPCFIVEALQTQGHCPAVAKLNDSSLVVVGGEVESVWGVEEDPKDESGKLLLLGVSGGVVGWQELGIWEVVRAMSAYEAWGVEPFDVDVWIL